MKKVITQLLCIAFMLLFSQVTFAQVRDDKQPLLLKLLEKKDAERKTEVLGERRNPAPRMEAHRELILDLKAKGMKIDEISAFLNSQRNHAANGSISGIVYEEDGMTRASELVSIAAYDEFGGFAGSDFVFSSDQGTYLIDNLAPGRYYVVAAEFSTVYRLAYYEDAYHWSNAALVEVIENQQTRFIDFRLARLRNTLFGNGAIAGVVKDFQNRPVTSGVSIFAYDNDHNFLTLADTDSSGAFLIEGLGSGSYKLRARYSGQENLLSEWYLDANSFETATPIAVTDGDTTRNIDFTLEAGGAIAVKIVGEDGGFFEEWEVRIWVHNESFSPIYTPSQFTGQGFVISGLATGSYFLETQYNGQGNYLEVWHPGVIDTSDATPVLVNAPDTTADVVITMPIGAQIGGVVRFGDDLLPVSSIIVTAYDLNGGYEESSTSGSDGAYQIKRLKPGSYKLFVDTEWSDGQPILKPAFQWFDDADTFEEAQIIDVSQLPFNGKADIKLGPGGYISGSVLDENGWPLSENGEIDCYTLDGEKVSTSPFGGSGLYRVEGLRTGKYKLRMDLYFSDDFSDEWYDAQLDMASATPVSVTAPFGRRNINFTPEKPKKLSGFLHSPENSLLTEEAADMFLFAYDSETGRYFSSASNNFAGGFNIELLSGEYKVAGINIQANNNTKRYNLAATWIGGGARFDDPNTQTLVVNDDQPSIAANLTMENASGGIVGTIYNAASNQPFTEGFYMLFAYDEFGYLVKISIYGQSNDPRNGSYYLAGVRPGNYYVLAILFAGETLYSLASQWLGGIHSDTNIWSWRPYVEIPSGAQAVGVDKSLVSNNDFFFDLTTGLPSDASNRPASDFQLFQNYPNPFNPSTTISYNLPVTSEARLIIYDLLGREIRTLVNEVLRPGRHSVEWDGTDNVGAAAISGVYFYQLKSGKFVETKKLVLIK